MPNREVHSTEGVAWLSAQKFGPEVAVVTSMPDSSEVPGIIKKIMSIKKPYGSIESRNLAPS